MMRVRRGRAALTVCAALLVVAAAGCRSSSSGSGPIKLGALAQKTGQAFATDVAPTARLVFDEVNANGGINGRKIEYIVKDDAGNPQRSQQVARELVDQDGVVALVGSATFVDCESNATYYARKEIYSIPGVGVGPQCFSTPYIAPVNTGPFTAITAILTYASERLGDENICAFFTAVPGLNEAVEQAINRWKEQTGHELAIYDNTVQQGASWTPYLLRAEQAGCDAIVYNGAENAGLPLLKAAKTQGLTEVDYLFFPPSYTLTFAEASANLGLNVYVGAEFEPYTIESQANADWLATLEEAGIAPSGFSQGGYLSATFMVEVLKTIEGDITRESVGEALRTMEPISHPMVGTPFVVGKGKAHAPNQSIKVVKLEDGKWVPATEDFIRLTSEG